MISPEDVLALNFYTYNQPFTGSDRGMRYRLQLRKEAKDEAGNVTQTKALVAHLWPEPFAFEKTDPGLIVSRDFPFTEEGRLEAVAWLNEAREAGEWQPGFKLSRLKAIRNTNQ